MDESKRVLSAKLNKEEDRNLSHLTLNMQQMADDTRLNGQTFLQPLKIGSSTHNHTGKCYRDIYISKNSSCNKINKVVLK